MNFDQLDEKMRAFEKVYNPEVMPEVYLVARLDGRSFSRLTKTSLDFDAPFDDRFKDLMIETVKHLMGCGFKVTYGYTQSDEMSLLFDFEDQTFRRKVRKMLSILAGEASGAVIGGAGVVRAPVLGRGGRRRRAAPGTALPTRPRPPRAGAE